MPVEISDFGPFKAYTLRHSETGAEAVIVPDCGAMLTSLKLPLQNNDLIEVVAGAKNIEEFNNNAIPEFRSSVLVPFPNRVNKGKYTFNGIEYQLPINFKSEGNAIHGLVAEVEFNKIKVDQENGVLECTYTCLEGFEGYPFAFDLNLIFRIGAAGITLLMSIENKGKEPMPAGLGYHPYFTLGKKVNCLNLQLPKAEILAHRNLIPTGEKKSFDALNNSPELGDLILDDCLELVGEDGENHYTTLLVDSEAQTGLVISQMGGSFLQIYTPTHRDFIAIEPMTCAPDAFNNGIGLAVINPGQFLELAIDIRLVSLG